MSTQPRDQAAARARPRAARTAGRRRAARSRPGATSFVQRSDSPSQRDEQRERPRERAELARRARRRRRAARRARAPRRRRRRRAAASRFACVDPTCTGIRAGTQASVATASSHGTRSTTHAPTRRGDRADDGGRREQRGGARAARGRRASAAQPTAHAASPATRRSRRGATISSARPSAPTAPAACASSGAHRDDHGRASRRDRRRRRTGGRRPARFGARRCSVPRGCTPEPAVQPPAHRRRVGRDAEREARAAAATTTRVARRARRSAPARSRTGYGFERLPARVLRRDRQHVAARAPARPAAVELAVPGQLARRACCVRVNSDLVAVARSRIACAGSLSA